MKINIPFKNIFIYLFVLPLHSQEQNTKTNLEGKSVETVQLITLRMVTDDNFI